MEDLLDSDVDDLVLALGEGKVISELRYKLTTSESSTLHCNTVCHYVVNI